DPGAGGRLMAEVAREVDDAHVLRVSDIEFAEDFGAAVPAAVVHQDDFVTLAKRGQDFGKTPVKLLQARLFVVDRDDDGEFRGRSAPGGTEVLAGFKHQETFRYCAFRAPGGLSSRGNMIESSAGPEVRRPGGLRLRLSAASLPVPLSGGRLTGLG